MECITTKQTAGQWGITIRRVPALCVNGRTDGAKFVKSAFTFDTPNIILPSDPGIGVEMNF
jgi:hypothetical protein